MRDEGIVWIGISQKFNEHIEGAGRARAVLIVGTRTSKEKLNYHSGRKSKDRLDFIFIQQQS